MARVSKLLLLLGILAFLAGLPAAANIPLLSGVGLFLALLGVLVLMFGGIAALTRKMRSSNTQGGRT